MSKKIAACRNQSGLISLESNGPLCPSAGLSYTAPRARQPHWSLIPGKASSTCSYKDPTSPRGLCSTPPDPPLPHPDSRPEPPEETWPHPSRGSSSDPTHRRMADQPPPSTCPQAQAPTPTIFLHPGSSSILLPHLLNPVNFLRETSLSSSFPSHCRDVLRWAPALLPTPSDPPQPLPRAACSLPHKLSLSTPC